MKQLASVSDLRWQRFNVLSDGFVCLVDAMGDDSSVVQAARVSYGRDTRHELTGLQLSDVELIRYLMRNKHTTPFEMVELKFLVRVPMDCWRQWIRHRTASVNEYSTRYAEAIDSMDVTSPHGWRAQSKSNKQGSSGTVDGWPDGVDYSDDGTGYTVVKGDNIPYVMPEMRRDSDMSPGEYLSTLESKLHAISRAVYESRLRFGVAKEQARKDLPLSTYTEAYWKIDLHNLFHFLRLRLDKHAQLEIRLYAEAIYNSIVSKLFPVCCRAFEDYSVNSMVLSAFEVAVTSYICREYVIPANVSQYNTACGLYSSEYYATNREISEMLTKLNAMGIVEAT